MTREQRQRLRLARAVRTGRSGRGPRDSYYAVYASVLVAAVYLPLVWQVLAAAGTDLRPELVTWPAAALAAALVCLLLALSARRVGPVTTSAVEVELFMRGQFPPALVLRARAVLAVVTGAVLVAFVAGALASGVLTGGGPVSAAVAAGAAVGACGTAAWIGGQGDHRRRLVVLSLVAAALATAWLWREAEAGILAGRRLDDAVLVWAFAGAALAVSAVSARRVLATVDPDALLRRQSRWQQAGASALAGDQRGAALALADQPTRWRYARRPLLRRGTGVLVLCRDALGATRLPAVAGAWSIVALASLCLLLTGWLTPDGSTGRLPLIVAACAVYAATASWAAGMSDHVDHASVPGLLPARPGQVLLAHTVLPLLLGTVAMALATAVAALVAAPLDASVVGTAAATTAVALLTRFRVSLTTMLPPDLLTPVVTPLGDVSGALVAAWYLRGWLTVVAVPLLATWPVLDDPGLVFGVAVVGLGLVFVARAQEL